MSTGTCYKNDCFCSSPCHSFHPHTHTHRDMFDIVGFDCDSNLLPTLHKPPAEYDSVGTYTLDHPATEDDVWSFVVEYIQSDVLVGHCVVACRLLWTNTYRRECLGFALRETTHYRR